MANRDVIVVGASAGGIEALLALVGTLAKPLPAAILVVVHVPRDAPGALPKILDRSGPLPAGFAVDGERPRPGRIYVAPADRHLLLVQDRIRLSRGPTENGHRPAVDPLFRSAARSFGPRVIAVVLSGARDDGAAGLAAVVARGGVGVVQDPDDAPHPSMPRAALERCRVDHVCRTADLGSLLSTLAGGEVDLAEVPPAGDLLTAEVKMAASERLTTDEIPSRPAGLGCPACYGSLFDVSDETMPRYRCRIGHAWSPDTLLAEQSEALEGALWTALRALEEKAALARRLVAHAQQRGNTRSAQHYQDSVDESDGAARLLRGLITDSPSPPLPNHAAGNSS